MLFSKQPVRKLCLVLALFGAAACGDDEEDEDDPHGEVLASPSCQEISEACHAADTGAGPAHECHGVAHEDVEADCATAKVDCLASCAP